MQKFKRYSRGGKEENVVRNYAAIDLGTNSCRLVIASPTPTSFHIIETFSRITRLGEGIIKENELGREATRRTIKALKICSEIISEYAPIFRARFVATAACRRAKNCKDFLSDVKRQTGLNLEIISSQEESRLAVIGCMPLLKRNVKRALVFDIGGGSTEITLAARGSVPRILHTVSIPWGARNASEKFDLREYDKSHAARLAEEISAYSRRFAAEAELEKYRDDLCFVATSSTPLRLTHIARGWESYNRSRADGVKMNIEEFDGAIAKVHGMTCAEMAEDLNIGPVRAEIFHAGCVIFSQIYRDLGAPHLISSLKSAVDGIIMELQNG